VWNLIGGARERWRASDACERESCGWAVTQMRGRLQVRWSGDANRTRKCTVRVYAGESVEVVDEGYIQLMHVELFDGTAAWAGVLTGEGALPTPAVKASEPSRDYTGQRAIVVASKAQASVSEYTFSFPSSPPTLSPSLLCLARLTCLHAAVLELPLNTADLSIPT